MPKFKIKWVNTVTEIWELEVEAENYEAVEKMWNDNTYDASNSVETDSIIECTALDSIEEIKTTK
jgi:hypothetical protein